MHLVPPMGDDGIKAYSETTRGFAKIMLPEKKNVRDQQRAIQSHILNARLLFCDKTAFCYVGGDGAEGWQESTEDASTALIPWSGLCPALARSHAADTLDAKRPVGSLGKKTQGSGRARVCVCVVCVEGEGGSCSSAIVPSQCGETTCVCLRSSRKNASTRWGRDSRAVLASPSYLQCATR